MSTPMDIKKLLGARMTGPDGEELGTIEQIFFDDVTGAQEWARLRMGGLLGGKDRFVPLMGSSLSGKDLAVPYDKTTVKDSPELTVDRHITPEQESQLRSHYGLEAGTQSRTTTTPSSGTGKTSAAASAAAAGVAGGRTETPGTTGPETRTGEPGTAGVTSGAAGAAGLGRERERTGEAARPGHPQELALTRCEERIAFHTEEIELGRVRLHKYVDVVPVEERVRLVHEEFELERLPVTEGAADIREDSVEVVLRGQEAFAVKEIHPVERVRLNIKQVPQERVIRDEIRRERIEIERIEGTPGTHPTGRAEGRGGMGAESSVDRSDEPPGPGRGRKR